MFVLHACLNETKAFVFYYKISSPIIIYTLFFSLDISSTQLDEPAPFQFQTPAPKLTPPPPRKSKLSKKSKPSSATFIVRDEFDGSDNEQELDKEAEIESPHIGEKEKNPAATPAKDNGTPVKDNAIPAKDNADVNDDTYDRQEVFPSRVFLSTVLEKNFK